MPPAIAASPHPRARLLGALIAACLAVSAAGLPAHAQEDSDDETGQEMFNTGYKVSIEGSVGGGIKDRLRAASRLVSLTDYPPVTVSVLRSRAQADVERLMAVLRSEGYYGADIGVSVDQAAEPVTVTFSVSPGTRYRLSRMDVAFTRADSGLSTDIADYGIETGGAARAADVVAADGQVLRRLGQQGYPFAEMAEREVVVDHESETMMVDFLIDPGPLTRFDGLNIEGAESVEADFIRRYKLWEPGDIYDQRLVDEMRSDLIDSSLFATVGATPQRPPEDGGQGEIDLTLTEAEHRTIGGGARYSRSRGFGVRGFWEHRNFFNRGERLRTEAELAELRQALSAELYKPQFLRRGQALIISSSLRREDTDAYRELAIGGGVALDRELGERWNGSLGTTVELTKIRDNETDENRTFLLFGLPVGLRYDGTNSRLDPTRGSRLRIQMTPYTATINRTSVFVKSEVNASSYWQVTDAPRVVMAGRTRMGAIFGGSRTNVPASKRFYAGGGGSIRGIDYQEAGPLDAEGDPLGGRSVAEVALEARVKVTETIGVVPFLDGGTVYRDNTPSFKNFLWAGGLGLRYHTAVGPVRLDVAVPINPEPAHQSFQFYISLGQAF